MDAGEGSSDSQSETIFPRRLRLHGYYTSTAQDLKTIEEYKKRSLDIIDGHTDNTILAEQPPGFKIKLWDHQRAMLHRMKEYEKDICKYTTTLDMGVLSNMVGSGKSAIILALIQNDKEYAPVKKLRTKYSPLELSSDFESVKYYCNDNNINSNLIVVPHGIYNQWLDYIRVYTDLSVYGIDRRSKIIEGVNSAKEFYSNFDIVLCKTTMFNDMVQNSQCHSEISNIKTNSKVVDITRKHDLIKFGRDLPRINCRSIYTPVVRTTTQFINTFDRYISEIKDQQISLERSLDILQSKNIQEIIDEFKVIDKNGDETYHIEQYRKANGCVWNRVIFDEADSVEIGSPAKHFYRVDGYMTWLITSSIHSLVFNGGATNEVTNRTLVYEYRGYGFVSDIIRANYCRANYINVKDFTFKNNDNYIRKCLEEIIPAYTENFVNCFTPPELRVLNGIVSEHVINMINAGDVSGAIHYLGCKAGTQDNFLKNFTSTNEKRLEHNKKLEKTLTNRLNRREIREDEEVFTETKLELQNVKQNIASISEQLKSTREKIQNIDNDVCPICYDTTQNPCIVPCCRNSFCTQCVLGWLDTKNTCPMCRAKVDRTQLSLITSHEIKEPDLPTKIKELGKILSSNDRGKFLVFSEFGGSFGEIVNYCNKNNIATSKLAGNAGRITNTIKKYANSEDRQILLLNAKNYGSGLNLHMTTDIVFYHRMSVDMEKQVIGRGQRAGRTSPLKVHYLCYDNEM